MRILLSGAGGLLGTAIGRAAAARAWDCAALARPALEHPGLQAALAASLAGRDLLVHAAANTNVEQCETDPGACYRDNLLLTEVLATAAARAGVPMLFVSSTGVYGDGAQPWREYHDAVPTTHHHRSKLLAERRVLACAADNLVLRTGWLFGGPAATPKNFVARRIDEARQAAAQGRVLHSNAQQRGVPCHSDDVAARMLDAAAARLAGVFNCVNSGAASRHEYVQAIVEEAGIAVEVLPAQAAAFGRKARVSDNEMAENWKFDMLGWAPLPHWRDSLRAYLAGELAPYLLHS